MLDNRLLGTLSLRPKTTSFDPVGSLMQLCRSAKSHVEGSINSIFHGGKIHQRLYMKTRQFSFFLLQRKLYKLKLLVPYCIIVLYI